MPFLIGYYAGRLFRATTIRWILVGLLFVLFLYAVWGAGERRQRKALENNPITTVACYEDAWRPCHVHEMDTTP